jgi:hypothetical protein
VVPVLPVVRVEYVMKAQRNTRTLSWIGAAEGQLTYAYGTISRPAVPSVPGRATHCGRSSL